MRIEWSNRAQEDLSNILRYIVESFGLNTAVRVNVETLDTINILADFPYMGEVLYEDSLKETTYYSFSTRYYKVIYTTNDTSLYILMLWNNRRDQREILKQLSFNEKNNDV